eukprot:6752149-Prymnesium_polylepis.1
MATHEDHGFGAGRGARSRVPNLDGGVIGAGGKCVHPRDIPGNRNAGRLVGVAEEGANAVGAAVDIPQLDLAVATRREEFVPVLQVPLERRNHTVMPLGPLARPLLPALEEHSIGGALLVERDRVVHTTRNHHVLFGVHGDCLHKFARAAQVVAGLSCAFLGINDENLATLIADDEAARERH